MKPLYTAPIKYFIAATLIFLSANIQAEPCPLTSLEEKDYTESECQFYLGTTAFRAEMYTIAAAHWRHVVRSSAEDDEEKKIKTMTLGTLAYLIYYGKGVKQNKHQAVKMWEQAAKRGSLESRKHLAFVYSDQDYKDHDLIKALGWHQSIIIQYADIEDLSESQKNNLDNAITKSQELEEKMSERDITAAKKFAQKVLESIEDTAPDE